MGPAVFTFHDLWTMFLTLCAAICTSSAAVVIVVKVIEHFKQPNKDQDRRIEELEESIRQINERLEQINEQFKKDAERMDKSELAFKNASIVMIESLQALTAHAIDGNNTEELRASKKKLDSYLLNK